MTGWALGLIFAALGLGCDGHRPKTSTDNLFDQTHVPDRAGIQVALLSKRQGVGPRYNSPAPSPEQACGRARSLVASFRSLRDPRYLGYAQSSLGLWWSMQRPPTCVLLERAVIQQSQHAFGAALEDLNLYTKVAPEDASGWLTLTTVLTVMGRFDEAKQACEGLRLMPDSLVHEVCRANLQSLTGQAHSAQERLEKFLKTQQDHIDPTLMAWGFSVLGDVAQRAGDDPRAERFYRRVLELEPKDFYTRLALIDLLLDVHRVQDALAETGEDAQDDALVLRRAMALHQLGDARAMRWIESTRYAAQDLRGDRVHLRERAWFELYVQNNPSGALKLAIANWDTQHESHDARVLLDAAYRSNQPCAAKGVVQWMAQCGFDEPRIVQAKQRISCP